MAEIYHDEVVKLPCGELPIRIGGSGPPLLFLHGINEAGIWSDFLASLARGFTVHAPIHPGFGGTTLPDWVQGVDDLAFHYIDLITTLGLQRPLVMGNSIGGWIATELAIFRPDLIGKLVLASALGLRPENPSPDMFILDGAEESELLSADGKPDGQVSFSDPEVLIRRWEDQAALARLMWKRPYDPRLDRRLHHIAAPTLVIWGECDRLLPASHGARLSSAITGSRFLTIRDAGHLISFDRPSELAQAIIEFGSAGRK
ncbi:MAG: alpha/beta hydrolase [Candidatus Binataceae bacterium]|nr:alpha/beta hydrolase [Candidatus Binataceae bacterium]